MFGPIYSLRLYGLLLPCCESEESASARASLSQIQKIGARVDWHAPSNKQGVVASGLSRFFGRQTPSSTSDTEGATPSQIKIVDATKDSINHGQPYPELQIKPLPKAEAEPDLESGNKEGGLAGLKRQTALSYQLDIPLHHIERIDALDTTMLVIITCDASSLDENKLTKEAARLSFRSSDDRDKICLDLKVIVEWNKQRHPDMEEDLQVDGIRARAQKAAHFAKRELEMRETKRNREQRKAKYMEGTMGLKYTAMAMANREMT